MRPTLIALALTAAAALPAQALTVFSDDFETGVKGGNVTPTGWTVSDGSVDVVYPGWFGGLCLSSGRCVDLGGSTGNAGVLSQRDDQDRDASRGLLPFTRAAAGAALAFDPAAGPGWRPPPRSRPPALLHKPPRAPARL